MTEHYQQGCVAWQLHKQSASPWSNTSWFAIPCADSQLPRALTESSLSVNTPRVEWEGKDEVDGLLFLLPHVLNFLGKLVKETT